MHYTSALFLYIPRLQVTLLSIIWNLHDKEAETAIP